MIADCPSLILLGDYLLLRACAEPRVAPASSRTRFDRRCVGVRKVSRRAHVLLSITKPGTHRSGFMEWSRGHHLPVTMAEILVLDLGLAGQPPFNGQQLRGTANHRSDYVRARARPCAGDEHSAPGHETDPRKIATKTLRRSFRSRSDWQAELPGEGRQPISARLSGSRGRTSCRTRCRSQPNTHPYERRRS